MEKKHFSIALEKAGDFINKLTVLHFDILGYPTIVTHSDYVDVKFTTNNTISDLDLLDLSCDEFRIFADGCAVVIEFTFYADNL